MYSSPSYRALDAILPSAETLRAQQRELILRRAEVLRAIGQELSSAMAQGHDAVLLRMNPGWRERALRQQGFEVTPARTGAPDAFVVYFGDRDTSDKSALLRALERPPQSASAPPLTRPPSPPSPSVYAQSVCVPASPPPSSAPQRPLPERPPFDRGHTVPGPEYRSVNRMPERTVAFEADVRNGAYTPAPGRRF